MAKNKVVICSKFITFAVTKTTFSGIGDNEHELWFAQNSLPLRWQRQLGLLINCSRKCCDLLKIHYLCGDKDNLLITHHSLTLLWFAQNSLPLRWQRQLLNVIWATSFGCDLLKIHYLCGDKDNSFEQQHTQRQLWFAQNSLPLRWQRQPSWLRPSEALGCDLLKIHYLCGDKDNLILFLH